jgi:hypothetical protein
MQQQHAIVPPRGPPRNKNIHSGYSRSLILKRYGYFCAPGRKLLCDVPAASAILDRLLHHAENVSISGRSYRLKEGVAEQNQRQASQAKKENNSAWLPG